MDLDDFRRIADAHYKARSGIARQIRKDARISMAEVAAALDVSESAVSRWESGSRLPRGETAIRWARLLDELERINQPAVA